MTAVLESSSAPSEVTLFGQDAVRKILEELGGKATVGEVSAHAGKYYPTYSDETRYKIVGRKLSKLKKWRYVDHIKDQKTKKWFWVLREYSTSVVIGAKA